jgi:hypothetical protein
VVGSWEVDRQHNAARRPLAPSFTGGFRAVGMAIIPFTDRVGGISEHPRREAAPMNRPSIFPTMTKGQLAQAYGISVETLLKWMDEFKITYTENGKLLTPNTVKDCWELIGEFEVK